MSRYEKSLRFIHTFGSQETLKAAKSKEQEAKARQQQAAGGGQSPASDGSNPTKPTIQHHRRTASSGQAHELTGGTKGEESAKPQSPKSSSIQRRVSLKDDKLRAAIERIRDTRASPPPQAMAAEAPAEMTKAYSPKLTTQIPDAKPRKLGNKAADLFAKLQLRLSTGSKLNS